MKEMLLQYVAYNLWANECLGELLGSFPIEVTDREIKSSFPSLRKTAFHIRDAELIWLKRLQGESPSSWPAQENSQDDIRAFTAGSLAFRDFIFGCGENFFTEKKSFRNLAGEPFEQVTTQMIMHCMNHSTFHRGQLVTMIRASGYTGKIPPTDLVYFFRAVKPAQ
jgi:uncharacterized damage-inducible protein DinB